MAGQLYIVSNRVTVPSGRAAAGGLAVGVLAALRDKGGVWFGWSGDLVDSADDRRLQLVERGKVTYALLDLTEDEYAGYYGGMANRTLWPLFHYRIDLTSFEHHWYQTYRDVARLFAERLMELLEPDDHVWVQDFHLIPLGSELRRLGFAGRLGFFLHIPFPPAQLFMTMPWHRELGQDLATYDALPSRRPRDRDHFVDYAGASWAPSCWRATGCASLARHRGPCLPDRHRRQGDRAARPPRRRLAASTRPSAKHLTGRALIIGVDRLDYSKGIPERLRAYQALLSQYPQHRRKTVFLQVSAPSREDLPEYRDMRRSIERLAGHIVGRFGEADWIPLRYLNRTHSRRTLTGYYRAARVGR